MTTNAEIKFVSTEDLLAEIQDRFSHAVFMGLKVGIKKDTNQHIRRWFGSPYVCLGLTADLTYRILEAVEQDEEPLSVEDT